MLKVDNPNLRFTVTYARVSTPQRKDNLTTQDAVLKAYCENQGWDNVYSLTDIGSGLNYKKKGLLKLIDLLQRNEVERLVITDKDRLLRFGSELIFALCEGYNEPRHLLCAVRTTIHDAPRITNTTAQTKMSEFFVGATEPKSSSSISQWNRNQSKRCVKTS